MQAFRKEHEAKVEDYAKIAGSIHKQGRAAQALMDELGLDVNESLRHEAFERVATQGYSEEMVDLLKTQGFNDTQIAGMQNFTAQHLEELVPLNLTQTHDRLRDGYVQAVRDSANLSVPVLQNSQFFNRGANLTRPLSPQRAQFLDGLLNKTQAALDARNWTALGPAAKELAGVTFDYALQTGAPLFAERYRNATLAWAAAEIALSGDSGTADQMVEGLELHSHVYGYVDTGFFQFSAPGTYAVPLSGPLHLSLADAPPAQPGYFDVSLSISLRGPLDDPAFQVQTIPCKASLHLSGPAEVPCDVVLTASYPEEGQYLAFVDWTSRNSAGVPESGRLGGFLQIQVLSPAGEVPPGEVPPPPPPPPGLLVATGVTEPISAFIRIGFYDATAQRTVSVFDPVLGRNFSERDGTGQVQINFTNASVPPGHTVRVIPTCNEQTPTHTLTGFQVAEFVVPSGGAGAGATARCTYELKPEIPKGSISGTVSSEVGNPLGGVSATAVPVPALQGLASLGTASNEFGFYSLTNLPTPHDYSVTYKTPLVSADLSSLSQLRAAEVREVSLGLRENRTVNVKMRFAGDGLSRGFVNVAEKIGILRFQAAYNAWQRGTVDALIGIWCDGLCVDLDPHNPFKWWGDKVGTVYFIATGVGSGIAAARAAAPVGARLTLKAVATVAGRAQFAQALVSCGWASLVAQDILAAGITCAAVGLPFMRRLPVIGPYVDDAFAFVSNKVNEFAIRFGRAAQAILNGLGRAVGFEGADVLAAASARLQTLGINAATRLGLFRRGASITLLDDSLSELQRATAMGQAQGLDDVLNLFKREGAEGGFGRTFQFEEAAKLTRSGHTVALEGSLGGKPRDIVVDGGKQAWELRRYQTGVPLDLDTMRRDLVQKAGQISDVPSGVERVIGIDAKLRSFQVGVTLDQIKAMATTVKNDPQFGGIGRIVIQTVLGDVFL